MLNNFGTWNLLVYIKDDQSKEKNAFKLNIEKRKDMHFVNMPWKESHQILGDNYNYSLKERLSSTMNNLHKNSDLLKEYIRSKRVLESLKKCGLRKRNGSWQNLLHATHQAVVRDGKETTKVRVVYDAYIIKRARSIPK